MRNLAIIPARGGSKRIPRKNIKPFLQKPILAYSIEVALASNIFDEVMVSTDDQEIAEVAKAYGAKVPFVRSEANANDTATIADVILEVLTYYKTKNQHPEIICCLFATAPFVEKKILTEGFQKVQSNGYSSAFTIQKFDYPIFRSLQKNDRGQLEMFWPEHLNTRSQDLPEAFHDAGQVYFAKTAQFLKEKTFFMKNTFGIELNSFEGRDIDTPEDWAFAEQLYSIVKSGTP